MTDLVIFDCDGVLVDSERLSADVLLGLLADLGAPVSLAQFEAEFLGRSFPTVAATIRREHGRDLPADFEATYRARLLTAFAAGLRPTPGLAAMLARLAVPACVATSSTPARAERALRITGLWDRFGALLFTASEVDRGKPAPDLFLHAAAQMGADPAACLVIEDSAPGLKAAHAAGMPSLHYSGGAHLTGRDVGHAASLGRLDDWADLPSRLPHLFAAARKGSAPRETA